MSVYRLGRNPHTIDTLIKDNIEWVSIFPYFYQENEQTQEVNTPEIMGQWTKRDSVYMGNINNLHQKGIRVMLKPHLWMSDGWRSNIHFDSEEKWNVWFESYRKTMLHYAAMASETHVELFCIGTELNSSIEQQPDLWETLIRDIKTIYKGKLTYAANWNDRFEHISFWSELDYIGIQAYFPLTTHESPDLDTIKKGWDPHIEVLENVSEKYNKPILFTEIGYRNDIYATIKPWEWGSAFTRLHTKKSDKTQQLAYEALFSKLWDKKWFAGMYAWQWNSGDFPIRSNLQKIQLLNGMPNKNNSNS